jgi:putative flippase GtrA
VPLAATEPAATEPAAAELPAPRSRTERLVERLRQDDTLAQFVRFVLVGSSTTIVYALLFIPFESMGYLTAHLIGTTVSTVLANEMHRRLTFHAEDRVGWLTAQWEAGGVTVAGLLATSATLGWLDTTTAEGHVALQITAVVTVTAIIGLLRFVALRWIFRHPAVHKA